jgi:phospholipid/cholesterol/gamma-HCH transport system substrate-binding protein
MKSFSERNLAIIGAVGVGVIGAIVVPALNYTKLPLFNHDRSYTAYFTEASGLMTNSDVQVSGFPVGEVTGVELDSNRVLVTFKVSEDIWLGDRTEASIRAKSLLGTKVLEITPRGDAPLSTTIPVERTAPAYQLPDALGELSATISGLNTDSLNQSLSTLADTFRDTPPDLRAAVAGVSRFAKTLNERDAQLRELLANANKTTTVLAERSDQIATLIRDTNAFLAQLTTQSGALDQIAGSISMLAQELSGLVDDNRAQLKPALDKLNGVLTMVDNRKSEVQKSIKLLNNYALSLGESVSSGPFFKSYVANLLPGQFLQPFIDAAFSDLGLDPNVLLPSQLTDPQVGQPGTPALPAPFPRTGQGGEPRLNLPDAITGNPGDPRYPYREPLPAPPPGGPPPGPPAPAPAGQASTPEPTPSPVYEPAPNEAPSLGPPPAQGAP